MPGERDRYPLKKALLNDLFCQVCMLGVPALWFVCLWKPIKILLGWKKVAPVDRRDMWDWIPAVAIISVVLPLIGWARARYLQGKLSGALAVTGRVVRIGKLTMRGWTTVDFTYDFGGHNYTGTTSVPKIIAEGLEVGAALELRVPPRSPSKAYLKSTYV